MTCINGSSMLPVCWPTLKESVFNCFNSYCHVCKCQEVTLQKIKLKKKEIKQKKGLCLHFTAYADWLHGRRVITCDRRQRLGRV